PKPAMRPGVTVKPLPDRIRAPTGGRTSRPTASITPSRRTIVPFSSVGPETVTIRAPVIAYRSSFAPWARAGKIAAVRTRSAYGFLMGTVLLGRGAVYAAGSGTGVDGVQVGGDRARGVGLDQPVVA